MFEALHTPSSPSQIRLPFAMHERGVFAGAKLRRVKDQSTDSVQTLKLMLELSHVVLVKDVKSVEVVFGD